MADKKEAEAAAVDPIVDQGAQAKELNLTAADPVVDQGAQAKELNLTAADCPYGVAGDNRAKWFEGFGEADPEAPAAE